MPLNIFKLSGTVDVDTGKAEANLKKIDRVAKQTQSALNQADAAGKKAGHGMAGGFSQANTSANRLTGTVGHLRSMLNGLKAPNLNFGGGGGSGGGLGGLVGSLTKANIITGAISSAFGGLTDAMKEGWSQGIEYNKMLEKANISFTTLLGSTAKAQEHLKALQAFGEATPFEFPDLIKASQRMQAMGFTAKDIIPTLRNVGDAVSAVGGGKEELDGVILALGQMKTKGKVSAEEMNQLAERGIPAWDLLAQKVGMTKGQLMKLSEQGKLSGGGAVDLITKAMGEKFGGQMDKMSATMEGRESNFQDILQRRLSEATKGNFEQLKNAYEKGTEGLNTAAGGDFAKKLDETLTKLGSDFTGVLQKFASGDYFLQGINSIDFGGKALQSFKEGDVKGLAVNGAQALGLKKGAAGEDQISDFVANGLKEKSVFNPEIDRKLISWITGALMTVEKAARESGKMVGIGTGEGIVSGTQTSLDAHSPSRVMMKLGQDAMTGFGDGFNNAVEGEINRSSEGIKKWAKAIAAAGGEEFLKEVERIAANLKIDPNKLMNVMAFESRLDPSKKNPGSSATGLIQFMDSTAAQLGTTTAKLKAMNAIEQLKYVEEYFKQFGKLADTQEAIYTAVLAGRPVSDPKTVLFSKDSKKTGRAYTANSALDKDNSGTVTAAEATAQVLKQGFLSAGTSAEKSAGLLDQFSAAIDDAKAKIVSFADSLSQYVGLSAPQNIPAPKAVPKPQAVPLPPPVQVTAQAPAQTVQAGQLATTEVKAKTDQITLSKDVANATVQMQIPLKELPKIGTDTAQAMGQVTKASQEEIKALFDVGDATQKTIDHLAQFKDAFSGGIDQMFDDILDGKKFSGKDFAKSLFKGFLGSTISAATGGQANSPGTLLSRMLFGSAPGAGGAAGGDVGGFGGGSGVPATGGFAGGGGANDILGKGMNVASMFKQGGILSKLPGVSKVGGLLGKIPGLSKLGSLFGFGGGGGAAAGAGAAGAGGAASSGGVLAAMGGPVGIAVAVGSMVAAPLLSKLFSHDYLKDYRNLIKGEYGVDVKSQSMLGKVMQVGQSKFGQEWQHREIETVRLPEVRDMIAEYAQGYMLNGANSKLFNSADYSDPFSALNQVKVGMRAAGGPVMAGMPYIVGERRPELFIPSQNGRIVPSVDGHGGGWFGKAKEELAQMIEAARMLAEATTRLNSMPADHVVMTGLKNRPGLATADVLNSFSAGDEHARKLRPVIATR